MNCPEVRELMQRHVDGDLNAEETSHMLDHVGHCPDCAAMLERLLHLSRGLEQLPRIVPPYSLVDAILPQLGNGEAAGAETADETVALAPRERRAARSRREWMGRLSGVAAVAIVVGLLLVGGPSLFQLGVGNNQKDAASAPEASAKKATAFSANANQRQDALPQEDLKKALSDKPAATVNPAPVPKSAKPSGSGASVGGSKGLTSSSSPSPAPDLTKEPDQASAAPRATGPAQDKGGPVTPADPTAPTPTMGIMKQVPADQALSPDGQWKAVLKDGQLQMIRISDDAVVYDPAPDGGTRSSLAWKDDSTAVTYTYTDAEGNSSNRSFLISEMKEQTSP